MYKLLIQDKDYNWKTADLGDDKPAMNYQSNNIAELKDRQASYSQALKLPLTQNNCLIFDHSDSPDVVTDFPYQKHNCRLFCNDFILAGPGSFLILDKKTEFFEVQILSGNAVFFTLLNQPMSNLDLGSLIRNFASFNPDNFGPDGVVPTYEYAAATFTKVAEKIFRSDLDDLYPFILLRPAIESLISQNEYTLQTNLTDAQWNKKALSLCSLKPDADSFDSFKTGEGYINTSYAAGGETGYGYHLVDDGNGTFSNVDYQTFALLAKIDGIIKLDITKTLFSGLLPSGIQITVINETTSTTIETITNTNEETITVSVPVKKADILKLHVEVFAGNVGSMRVDFKINDYISEEVPLDGILHFSRNLGFETQFDLFKAFVQLFGLTVDVNNETKIVRAYTMQELYDNKPIAKDWSEKLHNVRSNEMNYVPLNSSYAQSNWIRFEDNADDNVKDSGLFTITNNTLELTKDLFTLKFEAGFDRIFMLDWIVANIPLNEISVDNLTTTFKGGKPHIIELSTDTIEFTVYGSLFYYHIATHAKVQSFIDTFYPDLITMLTGAKYMIDEFYLTDKDIENFDQFTPVFVQKYGAYFYVNKINNYISKQLTKVELIKL